MGNRQTRNKKCGGRKTKRNRKMKGGDPVSPGFIKIKDIKHDENGESEICAICQGSLLDISDKGIIYQLSCGHQFHNNCLSRWCDINTEKVDAQFKKDHGYNSNSPRNGHFREPVHFKCPICNRSNIDESNDCLSMDAFKDNYLFDKEQFTSEEYTGIKPEKKPKKSMFSFFNKGGKTKKNRKQNKKSVVIGKIYADWCGHCKTLKPEWESMKNKIKTNMGRSLKNVDFEFSEMGDTQENQQKNISVDQLVEEFNKKHFPNGDKQVNTDGFPTIFKICRKKIEYYSGPRTANEMYKWATKNC